MSNNSAEKSKITFEFSFGKPEAEKTKSSSFSGFTLASQATVKPVAAAIKPISIFQEAMDEKVDEADQAETKKQLANVRTGVARLKQHKQFFRHYSMPNENSVIPKQIPQNKYFETKVEMMKKFEIQLDKSGGLEEYDTSKESDPVIALIKAKQIEILREKYYEEKRKIKWCLL